MTPRYYLGVASLDHVREAVEGGFCQFAHGKMAAVTNLAPGDWVVYYSPGETIGGDSNVQAFTAIGEINGTFDRALSRARHGDATHFRRSVKYHPMAEHAAVRPLLHDLSFVTDPQRWGVAFRTSKREISRADFTIIASAMGIPPMHRET